MGYACTLGVEHREYTHSLLNCALHRRQPPSPMLKVGLMAENLIGYADFVKLVVNALEAADIDYLIGGALASWV